MAISDQLNALKQAIASGANRDQVMAEALALARGIPRGQHGGLLGDALGTISGNPLKDAKSVVKNDQRNVGRAVETLQPVVEHALRNNPATLVAGTDKQAADALGWDWLQHMTGKTEQTFERTSNKAAGFQELFERQLAERMKSGQPLPQAINDARLEADRAHARTNSGEDIQAGINRGEYRVQGNDVVDRYGNSVLGKGLAQRGSTALGIASLAFPWLAPYAAAAQSATAYRHGAPIGQAAAQGIGTYYAGKLGGQYGGQLGGQAGAAAGTGAARGLTSGYAQGLRGGELLEAGALGGLSGGLGQWASGYGGNPFTSGLYGGAARGLVSGYRQGDIGQGIQQGLLSGGLSGAGNWAGQQYGQWARPIPQFAYRQLMRG